jgi:ABC-2 type transporter
LVNADFSDDAEVDKILDTWEEKRPEGGKSSHHNKKGFGVPESDGQEGVMDVKGAPIHKQMAIIFRRHALLIARDPILYLGRGVVFLIANTIFALVYLKARPFDQDQALNKMWGSIWWIGVPSQMGAVVVYALNDEFKTVVRESKNGMIQPLGYALAKSLLTIPVIFLFAILALAVPAYAILDMPIESFGIAIILWAVVLFVYESVAECLSVWVDDPIIGMMQVWSSFVSSSVLLCR